MVINILPIDSIDARVFYDLSATYSFVSLYFASRLGIEYSKRAQDLVVSTPLKDVFLAKYKYRACVV